MFAVRPYYGTTHDSGAYGALSAPYGASSAAKYATAMSLTSAGGTAAAAGGPPGWIVGGALAAAGGTVALVTAIGDNKIDKAAAVKAAKKLGIKDAKSVPGFTKRAMKWAPEKRAKVLTRLKKALARKKRGSILSIFRNRNKLEAKVQILEALLEIARRKQAARKAKKIEARNAKMAVASARDAADEAQEEAEAKAAIAAKSNMPAAVPWLLGAAGLGLLGFIWWYKKSDAAKGSSRGGV